MHRMSSQIDNIVNAYKVLSKVPTLTGAKLNKAGTKVTSKWSVRNLDKGKPTKFQYDYVLDESFNVVAETDFGIDVSNELLSAVSPTERWKAIIREQSDSKDSKKQYLEVWQSKKLAHSIDLAALDIHGDVYTDSEFGTLDWCEDEKSIVYIAEKKKEKFEPYIKRKPAKDAGKNENGAGETAVIKGEEFVYKQDWGEQLVGKHLSVIVVCHIETETFTVIQGVPETLCPGQVKWIPGSNGVVGVAWETEPRRLGLIFCNNRPGHIFTLTLDGQYRKISQDGFAVRSPRFAPNGEALYWLQRKAGGPHGACLSLVRTSWPTGTEVETVIDKVNTSIKTENRKDFTGIYAQALPNKCFALDSNRIIFSSPQRTEVRSFVATSSRIVDISDERSHGSTTILDVKGDIILATKSSLNSPSQLIIAKLPAAGKETEIKWLNIGLAAELPDAVKTSQFQYLELEHKDSNDSVKSFSAIYFAPPVEADRKLPLIVWPHGGPHSGFVNAYSMEAALLSMMGFASILINYRGSTGNGDNSVHFLLGKVGTSDVLDCKLATDIALEKFPIHRKKLCLFGGSHGGFLVTHLSGQYPDMYAVVVSRNPVIDVSSMYNSTDIADWCAVEAGFEFTEKGPVSEETLLAMRRASPMAHVHKVKAPTALMLGSVDKRVPYYQGLEYYRRLKANSCVAKIFLYDDNHSLSSPSAEMDNMINSVHWFLQHLE